jgi:hypothetical protein
MNYVVIEKIISRFSCGQNNSSVYMLYFLNGEYVFEQTWYNASLPSDKRMERHSSLNFKSVAQPFIRSTEINSDTTKSYNRHVTDEQRERIFAAADDVRKYAQEIGVELNP